MILFVFLSMYLVLLQWLLLLSASEINWIFKQHNFSLVLTELQLIHLPPFPISRWHWESLYTPVSVFHRCRKLWKNRMKIEELHLKYFTVSERMIICSCSKTGGNLVDICQYDVENTQVFKESTRKSFQSTYVNIRLSFKLNILVGRRKKVKLMVRAWRMWAFNRRGSPTPGRDVVHLHQVERHIDITIGSQGCTEPMVYSQQPQAFLQMATILILLDLLC